MAESDQQLAADGHRCMLVRMDLEDLRGFLAIAETGSFLGAATNLGVPRGTLRRRIDALEARAGVPLLERNARGVTVTEAGAKLVERGRRLLDEGMALLAAVREVGREPTGPLRLHVPVGLPPSVFVALVEMHRVFMPEFGITLMMREDPLADLREDVDIAIHFGDGPASRQGIQRELVRMPIRVVTSPGYLARRGTPTSVAELTDLTCHRLAAWLGPEHDVLAWPLRAGGRVPVKPALISNDAYMLRQQVRAGFGLALLPDADLDPFGLPVDDLVPVLDELVGTDMALNLTMPEALADSRKIAKMVDVIREFCSPASRPRAPSPT
jgi:DNA-binding transcriptional LysR family regulator